MSGANLADWKPVVITTQDDLVAAPLRRLAGLLDHGGDHWPAGVVPPLAHWLYFLPENREGDLAADGHPHKGVMLPPIAAPRRMWAGGRLQFLNALSVGAVATRRSVVSNLTTKEGRSGTLTFVTVRHEIAVDGKVAIVEEQDLVFRDGTGGPPAPGMPDDQPWDAQRLLRADAVSLFRFSALTFNAHRIHYDLAYAQNVEGYPGLVVQGPYQAILLIDHLLRHRPGIDVASFSFRGLRPLFADAEFSLHLREDATEFALWTANGTGQTCMQATATAQRAPVGK